ncbi:MAG TPA: hypothetical protein VKR61_18070 [Bryobacteraceae bacterium]|nr:hypothetical protein [Bryobacteraceae bacterium]
MREARLGSLLGAAVFFVHPLQTESVAYIAGRSESLAALFILLGYTIFLYRRAEAISWVETALVLTCFALGVSSKENAVSLAGVLVLTDVYWPRSIATGGLRRDWKLFAAMAAVAAAALWKVFGVLAAAPSAGFSVRDITWYQYGFTEARAFFSYLRLAVIPIGQSIDHFYPVSHTILEHGAIVYVIALAGLIALCYRWRKRYPLACFGFFLMLILLAPTSSIVPIRDPFVERRMYLPLVGLILIGCEIAKRVRMRAPAGYFVCGVMLAGFYGLCDQRNQLWAEPSQLFVQAATESTNGRPYVNLVKVLAEEHRCSAAIPYLQRAEQRLPNDYLLDLAWGRALECVGHRKEALYKLMRAARLSPSSEVYTLIGCLYGEMGRLVEARVALRNAIALDSQDWTARRTLEVVNREMESDRLGMGAGKPGDAVAGGR